MKGDEKMAYVDPFSEENKKSTNSQFKCEKCNNIETFNIDISEIKSQELQGYSINQSFFKGTCKDCR